MILIRAHATGLVLLSHGNASRDRIAAFRNRHLRRVVRHAYATVAYYRELFDRSGIDPRDIRTIDDLAALPITSKHDLHERTSEEVMARGVDRDRLLVRTTGGSTGRPLVVRRSRGEERLLNFVGLRTGWYFGYDWSKPSVVVSAPRPMAEPRRTLGHYLFRLAGAFQWRQVSCLLPVEEIAAELSAIKPGVVGGYPGVLARVGRYLIESGRDGVRPDHVATGGEVCTPAMREQIAAGFRAPVYDTYGSHEFSRVAWECKETGSYHVADDAVILEILDEHDRPVGEGGRGQVVATALHSYAMPFIRYRLGDVVTKGSETCPCGAPFSTISSIQGRMVDYFQLPGGRLLHPYEIAGQTVKAIEALVGNARRGENPFPWLREYRYVQEREDRIVLYWVPIGAPPEQEVQAVDRAVRGLLGPAVEFEMIMQPQLETEANGKFYIYRSLVASAHSGGTPILGLRRAEPAPLSPELPAFDELPAELIRCGGRDVVALKRVVDLSDRDRAGMFGLLAAHYDGATPAQFRADLAEKEWVILMGEGGVITGFSTLMRIRTDVDGHPTIAFYSGDTVVRPDRRHVLSAGAGFFVRHLAAHLAAFPEFRHYYFHVAGTPQGYLMMPALFRVSRPRHDQPLTPETRCILGALARAKGLEYDPDKSIVRFANPTILRGSSADRMAEAAGDPHLRFYLEQNPDFEHGDRLASLVELSLDNFTVGARRLLGGRAPANPPPAASR